MSLDGLWFRPSGAEQQPALFALGDNAMTARRFPASWTVIENAESFWVQDAGGQTIGWFYFRHNEETARQAKVLTRDGARHMAVNFARLPELLGKADR
jgi:hypothetical protein